MNRKKISTGLVKFRRDHGFDSPIGRRCSNILAQFKCWADAEGELKNTIAKNIKQQIAEIEAILQRREAYATL